ncbi:MAG: phosphate acyltransferase [Salinivirgaceae bacterium]|jgi:phosphate butyryltransferase|nr:phosphate acyltransferase [Salinivirgaceae bacterium]
MKPMKSLDQMVEHLQKTGLKKRIAVANAQDTNTIGALAKAVEMGFAEAIMVGPKNEIEIAAKNQQIDPSIFTIIDIADETEATNYARTLVKTDEADVLMKGLVGTDKFLKAVLDKKEGLLPPKAVMSYVCAIEMPKYHKLLFVTDTAVLPFPDMKQKVAMLNYSVRMAKRFGIEMPKVALIGASEKVSEAFPNSIDYAMISKMAQRGQTEKCIVDGPLDVFLACDPESVRIKGVETPVGGDADVLLFPTLEACNSFYKGLMLFAGGELAGLIQGTEKPVVVMSRSESPKSKFYCVALSCLMSEN